MQFKDNLGNTMKFKFDSNLDFQLEAIKSVVDLFRGQKNTTKSLPFIAENGVIPNELGISERKLLDNVKNGKVFKKDKVVRWRCRNCGYIHEGPEAPKMCPACKHPQSFYEVIAENY